MSCVTPSSEGILPTGEWANGDVLLDGVTLTMMGLHFHWSQYQNEIAHFWYLGDQEIQVGRDLKIKWEDFYPRCKFITQSKGILRQMCENQRKFLSWDRENYIFPKVTKMGLYIYMWPQNRIDYNGVGF